MLRPRQPEAGHAREHPLPSPLYLPPCLAHMMEAHSRAVVEAAQLTYCLVTQPAKVLRLLCCPFQLNKDNPGTGLCAMFTVIKTQFVLQ